MILYASVTVILIIAFQLYWIYTTFQNLKDQIVKECEVIVKEGVLSVDSATYYKGLSTLDMELIPDKASLEKKIDSLFRHPHMQKINSELIYLLDKTLKEEYPSLKYNIAYNLLDKSGIYPTEVLEASHETQTIYSKMNSAYSYKVHFANLNEVVLAKMRYSILLTLAYLVLCAGAVGLLVYNTRKAGKLMQMKEDFTNNMTHELKTPLSTLLVATEALDKYNVIDDKPMAREYIQLMHTDLKRLAAMAEAILYNAKLSSGKINLEFTTLNLKPLLQETINKFKPRIVQTDATIEIDVPEHITIKADPEHIANVFSNLIDNAFKYTSRTPHINIKAVEDGSFVIINVADNGIGIQAEHHKNIFTPYFRVSEGDKHQVKGYGLGLSYSYEIVALHKGSLSVSKSELTTGTTFEIKLAIA